MKKTAVKGANKQNVVGRRGRVVINSAVQCSEVINKNTGAVQAMPGCTGTKWWQRLPRNNKWQGKRGRVGGKRERNVSGINQPYPGNKKREESEWGHRNVGRTVGKQPVAMVGDQHRGKAVGYRKVHALKGMAQTKSAGNGNKPTANGNGGRNPVVGKWYTKRGVGNKTAVTTTVPVKVPTVGGNGQNGNKRETGIKGKTNVGKWQSAGVEKRCGKGVKLQARR